MDTSRKAVPLVVMALAALAFAMLVAGCGGDDGVDTVPEVTRDAADVKPPKPSSSGKYEAEVRKETVIPNNVRNLRAQCRITIVTGLSESERERVQQPFFCADSERKIRKKLPASPFGAKDECRLDIDVPTLYKSDNPEFRERVQLDAAAVRLTPKCTKIYLVVTAISDETGTGQYEANAPITGKPLQPGQKAVIDLGSGQY